MNTLRGGGGGQSEGVLRRGEQLNAPFNMYKAFNLPETTCAGYFHQEKECLNSCLSVFLSFCLSVFLSFCLRWLFTLVGEGGGVYKLLSFCLSVFLTFCLSVFMPFCLRWLYTLVELLTLYLTTPTNVRCYLHQQKKVFFTNVRCLVTCTSRTGCALVIYDCRR